MDDELERYKTAVGAAQEIGQAWRKDWTDFDGRQLRSQLEDLDRIISGDWDLARFRSINDLCPSGGGHWINWCRDGCRDPTTNGDD